MNNPPVTITVSIKGEDSTYKQKFLVYEKVTLDDQDPSIRECIEEAKKHYQGDIEEIKLRLSVQWL